MPADHERRVGLIDRRKHLGLSQQRLAELVDVSISAISYWERGITEPLPRYRQPLADALNLDMSRLNRLIDPTGPLEVEDHGVEHWLDRTSLSSRAPAPSGRSRRSPSPGCSRPGRTPTPPNGSRSGP